MNKIRGVSDDGAETMNSKQITFFASVSDVQGFVSHAAEMWRVTLVESGVFPELTTLPRRIQDIATGMSYLILLSGAELVVRPVPQRRGQTRYAVDQLQNPTSIALAPGALVGERLLPGQIGTANTNPESIKLYECFAKAMCDKFTKIKSCYVGPEAMKLAASGIRLSQTEKSPVEYDLRLEDESLLECR